MCRFLFRILGFFYLFENVKIKKLKKCKKKEKERK